MKICVSSYSFSKLINTGEMNQLQTIEKAKELGFDGIEFSEIRPHDGSDCKEYAKKLKQEADRLEFPIVNFVFGADFINGRDVEAEEEVSRVKGMVDIAEILGVKTLRHDVLYSLGKYRSFEQALPEIVKKVRAVTEYAAQKGIRTSVENHGYISQDSDRVESLFNAVNHPNFGLLCDMGNFLCADENPVTAVSRVAPYAIFAHAKDFHVKSGNSADPGDGFFRSRGGNYLRGAIIGHGDVPVRQCLFALKRENYDGFISIEFEGMEHPFEGLSVGLKNLRRYINEVYSG